MADTLIAMGFSRQRADAALAASNGDQNQAMEMLLANVDPGSPRRSSSFMATAASVGTSLFARVSSAISDKQGDNTRAAANSPPPPAYQPAALGVSSGSMVENREFVGKRVSVQGRRGVVACSNGGSTVDVDYDDGGLDMGVSVFSSKFEDGEGLPQEASGATLWRSRANHSMFDANEEERALVMKKMVSLSDCKIQRIQRVHNPALWRQYASKRQAVARGNGGEPNELLLFHGTSSHSVEDIFSGTEGFDPAKSRAGFFVSVCKCPHATYPHTPHPAPRTPHPTQKRARPSLAGQRLLLRERAELQRAGRLHLNLTRQPQADHPGQGVLRARVRAGARAEPRARGGPRREPVRGRLRRQPARDRHQDVGGVREVPGLPALRCHVLPPGVAGHGSGSEGGPECGARGGGGGGGG